METKELTTTNDIRYSFDKIIGDKHYFVKIRLNDECKNGHEDFSITGEIYKAGSDKIDKNMVSCGAIGDKISKLFPKFKIFNDLHLATFDGVQMHTIANSFYHLEVGFTNTPPTSPEFKKEWCEYYRIPLEMFDTLNVNDKQYYSYLLEKLGVFKIWNNQAKEAIKILEELTDKKFKSTATKHKIYGRLSSVELKEVEEKEKTGYYSKENQEKREKQAQRERTEKEIQDLTEKANKKIESIKKEVEVYKFLLNNNFPTDNFIYYTHTNEGCFNWKSYEKKITQEELDKIISLNTLDVIFKLDNRK